jgi:putative flippase GtrA
MSILLNSWKSFRQVVRFLVVGGTATVLDLAVYLLLTGAGAGPVVAKALSFLSGMMLSFLGNKFWTFGSQRWSAAEPTAYAVVYGSTLAINVTLNGLALHLLAGALSPAWGMGVAFVIATGTTTVLNFLGLRLAAFRSPAAVAAEQSC